jgi:acyl CoA:acetate/3-ketoacid CoA transferase beta subunit
MVCTELQDGVTLDEVRDNTEARFAVALPELSAAGDGAKLP